MESKTPGQARARLIIVSVFVIGFVAGALSINLFERVTGFGAPAPENPQDHYFKKLKQTLDLNQDQQDRIKVIISNTYDEYQEIGKSVDPKLNVARQNCRDKIRAVLSADQLPKFEDMVKQHDRERQMKADQQNQQKH
jgi:hypothetical protein